MLEMEGEGANLVRRQPARPDGHLGHRVVRLFTAVAAVDVHLCVAGAAVGRAHVLPIWAVGELEVGAGVGAAEEKPVGHGVDDISRPGCHPRIVVCPTCITCEVAVQPVVAAVEDAPAIGVACVARDRADGELRLEHVTKADGGARAPLQRHHGPFCAVAGGADASEARAREGGGVAVATRVGPRAGGAVGGEVEVVVAPPRERAGRQRKGQEGRERRRRRRWRR